MADDAAPHDLAAERAVLGGILVDPGRFHDAAALVTTADFYRVAHRHVWAAMAQLHEAGTPIDFLTVRTALEAARHLEEVTVLHLSELVNGVPRAMNVAAYATIVREKAQARHALAALDRATKAIETHGVTPEILTGLSSSLTASAARRTDLVLTDVGALLEEGDSAIDWLVEDRFAYGSINLLAGRPKAGKSTLARALGLAVARGDRWLGSRCRPGRVVYVPLEDKRSEVRRHYQRMGATASEPIRFVFDASPQTLLSDLTARLAAGDQIDLLIIDTAQRLLGVKDTNDYALVTAALVPIATLARKHGICVVLLHHAGKSDRAGLESVLGSTAWAAGVDNVMVLNRTEKYRLVSSIQRIGPDLDETVVLMDEQTGDVRLGGSRQLVDLQAVVEVMVDAVLGAGKAGIHRADLLAAVEARNTLKVRALDYLLNDPRVQRTGAGTRSDPHVFRVTGNQQPETARASDSSSLVPLKSREPETNDLVSPVITGSVSSSHERAGSGGSHVVRV